MVSLFGLSKFEDDILAIFSARRRVVIVDDSKTIQAMLDNAFSQRADFCVVGFANDAISAAEMIRRLMPDVVTIDLCMPNLDGAALLGMIDDLKTVCKIIVSDEAMEDLLLTSRLLAAGASDCVGKSHVIRDPAGFFKKINSAAERLIKTRRTCPSMFDSPGRALPEAANYAEYKPIHPFPLPVDEAERLSIIYRKKLNNAIRERPFDLVTKHVAKVTMFPACLLTFIDRDTQWIKSAYGLDVESTTRQVAFCNYVIATGEAITVSNATADGRFVQNPLVTGAPNIRSYIGYPVVTAEGVNIGALCIIDNRVRTATKHVHDQLAGMAEIVAEIIEQRDLIAA